MSVVDQIIDWYWQFGHARESRYALHTSGWLDRLYNSAKLERLISASERVVKPTMAIWGPSQSGKSTLISSCVDAGSSDTGVDSALHWGKTPVRFSKTTDTTAIILNPHNFGSDASGCVSRFYLAKSVDDADCPVEIKLTTPMQVAHALAMGYLSECLVRDKKGAQRLLTIEVIDQIISSCGNSFKTKNKRPSRESFESLHGVCDLLDALIDSESPRYQNLKENRLNVRASLLNAAHFLPDATSVIALMAEILWDGHAPLTSLFIKLQSQFQQWNQQWGTRRIFCSMEVASILLDIDSYNKIRNSASGLGKSVQEWTYAEQNDRILINKKGPNKLVQNAEAFGLLQGLVLELQIPLREDVLRSKSPGFCDFLDASDLLDFPGVALAHEQGNETRLNLSQQSKDLEYQLFTQVLKRGKTASIVSSYARSFSIDGFSLLNRIKSYPAQPAQLIMGINTWWRAYDPQFEPGDRRPSPLPLNLVLTFGAELLNPVLQGGVREGLAPVFEKLKHLGRLADPSVLSHTLCTNYPQFNECKLHADQKQLQQATIGILKDPWFQKQFANDVDCECFQEMVQNGGTDKVFKIFQQQMTSSSRTNRLKGRRNDLTQLIVGLLTEALPTEAEGNRRRVLVIRKCHKEIINALKSATIDEDFIALSAAVRKFINISGETFEPIPLHLNKSHPNEVSEFVRRQITNWADHRVSSADSQFHVIGLSTQTEVADVANMLAESVNPQPIAGWLRKYLGNLSTVDQGKRARTFLAVRVSNDLLYPIELARHAHANPNEVKMRLDLFGKAEVEFEYTPATSPHFQHAIKPFIDRLELLAKQAASAQRPSLPGDAELANIAGRINESSFTVSA
jgi:hypothetical protein